MDNKENILFEQMSDFQPDWGQMMKPKPNVETEVQVVESVEKEYATLYDELCDKCNPNWFGIESFGLEKFQAANKIYAQLKHLGKSVSDSDMIILRNCAIDELGIHISTKKKFNELKSLFDTKQYVNKQPYDEELVSKAAGLYSQLLENKDDIRALEKLENNPDVECVKDEYDYMNLKADKYLEKHPKGKHVDKIKKELLEKEESDYENLSPEEYLKLYPNGQHIVEAAIKRDKKEKADFENKYPQDYLNLYPDGLYVTEALDKLDDQCFASSVDPDTYLKEFPGGRHVEEAKCYKDNWWEYLKKYPNGRYVEDAKSDRNLYLISAILLLGIVILITLLK